MAEGSVTRAGHLERAIYLEYLTIGWNLLESAIAIAAGSFSGSVALIGFGFDSLMETSSGGILIMAASSRTFGRENREIGTQGTEAGRDKLHSSGRLCHIWLSKDPVDPAKARAK